MFDREPSVETELFGFFKRLGSRAALGDFGAERRDLWVALGQFFSQRVVGGDTDERSAHKRVRAGGVDFDWVAAICAFKCELQSARLADPVLLHQLHFCGPVVEAVDRVEQLFREISDLEEPLRQLAPHNLGARAPAFAVDHLFVRQNGHIDRIPVHGRVLAVDQPFFEKVDEH